MQGANCYWLRDSKGLAQSGGSAGRHGVAVVVVGVLETLKERLREGEDNRGGGRQGGASMGSEHTWGTYTVWAGPAARAWQTR